MTNNLSTARKSGTLMRCEICSRCGGEMKPSKAIAQTYSGEPDFPGKEVVTLSPGGPGRLIDCLKCCRCGHSVSDSGNAQPERERL